MIDDIIGPILFLIYPLSVLYGLIYKSKTSRMKKVENETSSAPSGIVLHDLIGHTPLIHLPSLSNLVDCDIYGKVIIIIEKIEKLSQILNFFLVFS